MQKPGTPVTHIVNSASTGAAVTATQTTPSAAPYIHAGGYSNAVAYLDITAVTGTTPTLVVSFQDSPDGNEWTNVPSGAFSSQNATGVSRLALTGIGPYLRAVQTVGGTTPSFTYDLFVAGAS